jgi:RNA polymerase sigma-70 factor (ECF subfamily)
MLRGVRSAAERDAPRTSDAELMQQLAAGQLGALGELYDHYQAPLRSFIARVTRDAHDVDDLLHATFLAAAQSAERYDGRASCRPWLVGIAAQLLRRRRQTFTRFMAVISAVKGTLQPASDPRSALQARTDVERALAQLSEAKRKALKLRYRTLGTGAGTTDEKGKALVVVQPRKDTAPILLRLVDALPTTVAAVSGDRAAALALDLGA